MRQMWVVLILFLIVPPVSFGGITWDTTQLSCDNQAIGTQSARKTIGVSFTAPNAPHLELA